MSVKQDKVRARKRLAAAKELNVFPDNWIPPTAPPFQKTLYQQEFPKKNLPECERVEAKRLGPGPKPNLGSIVQSKPNSEDLPNPFDDFSHITEDEKGFAAKVKNLAFKKNNDAALARLKSAFEFIVCRTADLCGKINTAVIGYDPNNPAAVRAYDTAREAYITFLKNLDNYQPKKTLSEKDLKQGLGYGRHYSYLFVIPTIMIPPEPDGWPEPLITGATIILEWNPHSSSSGIPIKHS